MDLFEKQAQLTQLFQTSAVDVAYASGTASARKLAGSFAVDDEDVGARLVRLREYIGLLQDLKGVDRQKFKADPKLYGLAQWYLQQAVELTFGTGAYFIAALALPKPDAYHDILDSIAEHGI